MYVTQPLRLRQQPPLFGQIRCYLLFPLFLSFFYLGNSTRWRTDSIFPCRWPVIAFPQKIYRPFVDLFFRPSFSTLGNNAWFFFPPRGNDSSSRSDAIKNKIKTFYKNFLFPLVLSQSLQIWMRTSEIWQIGFARASHRSNRYLSPSSPHSRRSGWKAWKSIAINEIGAKQPEQPDCPAYTRRLLFIIPGMK